MHQNIKPNRSKKQKSSLSEEEIAIAKGLLNLGYRSQDIAFIMSLGRDTTISSGRFSSSPKELGKYHNIEAVSEDQAKKYLAIQSSYHPQTLLNPYKHGRIIRAREAMQSAVQNFNNPLILFKTEIFCVLSNIAWTYLVHEKMESVNHGSTIYKIGSDEKSYSLNSILSKQNCPIKDSAVKDNLKKVIEIRDAVEHTFFKGIDGCFGDLFQACCLNFERYLTKWFGKQTSLTNELSLSLQFVKLDREQASIIENYDLPQQIRSICAAIEKNVHAHDSGFRILVNYTLEASSKTNADITKLIKCEYDDESEYDTTVMKPYRPDMINEKTIVQEMQEKGFHRFTPYEHQLFWKTKWKDASTRNSEANKVFGEVNPNNQWYWYRDKWLDEVTQYCNLEGRFK
jgi:hypothetical protein